MPAGHADEYWLIEHNVAKGIFANKSSIDILDLESNGILKDVYEKYKRMVGKWVMVLWKL